MEKRRGLTLVEVIISLAIVGIIAVVFLNVFTSGIKNIFTTKRSTETFYNIENDVDNLIREVEDGRSSEPDKDIKIKINNEEIGVTGKLIEVEREGFQITTFVPYEKTSE